jgi:pyruvate dehydrogenase (quinone)
MSATVAQAIVDTLYDAGARRVYGIPGDTLNHVTDAIRRKEGLRWVHVRHEGQGPLSSARMRC